MVSGVNFITGILLARYLGLSEFGVFTLVWMAVLFASSLQFAFISAPMMSIGPKQATDEAPGYYGAVLSQQVVFAVLSFVFLYVGVKVSGYFFPDWQVQHLALPLASVAFAFQMQDFIRRYFFTNNRGRAAFVNDAISYLGQLGLLIWFFRTARMDSATVLWIIAGTSLVAVLAGIFSLEHMRWDRAILGSVARRHWHFSKWLTGSALMQWTSGNFFIVAAGGVLGASAVGALKAAQNVMGVTHILFQGLENIVPVKAGNYYHQGGSKALVLYLRKVAWAGGLATSAIAAFAVLFPEFLLNLFYGDEFAPYANLLRWYAAVYLVIFIGLPLRSGLRAIEHTRPVFTGYLLTTVFALVVFYPLVHGLGLLGVMIGLLAMQLIMQAVLWISLRKQLLVSKR
jgi:O-antigen/teichoic acid export membrane protein